ncbi:MAG: response regulator [Acidobacteria bacterium]|nr:response regulator [Acidobacteriota bacterium]
MSHRILIVDDEMDTAQMLRVILESRNYLCSIASNGKDGLQLILDEKPDLVLMDYMMPIMTGVEAFKLLRRIESSTSNRPTPVIMLTAKSDNEDEQKELLDLGLRAYITKPFRYQMLLETIGKIVTEPH